MFFTQCQAELYFTRVMEQREKRGRNSFLFSLFCLSIFSLEKTSHMQLVLAKNSISCSQTPSLHKSDEIIPAFLKTKFRKVFGTADIPKMFISELLITLLCEAQVCYFC